MLSEITDENNLTISACANILYEVHQEGTYRTIYSNIFDPVNLDIYFNYGRESTKHEKINLLEKLTEDESFEEKEVFFGITGTEGYVLVNTVKTNILSWTTNDNTPYIAIPIVLGVLCIPITVFILLKRRKKREIGK